MSETAQVTSSFRGMRQRNELAALRTLHQFGPLSRAELARRLGLNRSSSGNIIASLTVDGLVREVSETDQTRAVHSHAGRPGIMLELVPGAVYFLGIEIGVEHISAVEIDLGTNIISTTVEPFDGASAGVDATVERAIQMVLGAIPQARLERCEGIGVAVPAQMNKHGFVRLAPLLRWENVHLAELVRNAAPVSVPVVAENDGNAFAIGATYGRNEPQAGVTLFLVMESGVGGGIIVNGTLFRGANGLAGEIGHLRINGVSGETRSLEEVLGLEPIMAEYRKGTGLAEPAFEHFLADVRDRVPAAVSIAEEWARVLAFGLIQACRLIDADRIVLGGSVAALYPLMAARVSRHIQATQEASFPLPVIEMNDQVTIGPAYGAACILHQRYLSLESPRFAEETG